MDLDVQGLMAIGVSKWRKLINLNPGYLLRRAFWFTSNTLPVVGIDVVNAQDILFALRAADPDGDVAEGWLRAVQCAQLAHDRLLADLHEVDSNLTFWQRQVSAGGVWSHGAFMLLSRGPLSFAEDVAGATRGLVVRRLVPLMPPHLQPQRWRSQQSPAGGSGAEPRSGSAPPLSSAPAADASPAGPASATDMMQQRVLLLRGLRLRLARALAELTEAAGLLRVGDLLAAVAPGALPSASAAAVAAVVGSAPVGFAAAAAAVAQGRLPSFSSGSRSGIGGSGGPQERGGLAVKAVADAVRSAVQGMLVALEGLLSFAGDGAPPPPPAPGGSGADERSLSLELQRLLDLLRLQPYAARALGVALKPHRTTLTAPLAAVAPPPTAAAAAATDSRQPQRQQHRDEVQPAGGAVGPGGSGSGDGRPMGLQLVSEGCSAAAALGAARRAAALAGPLVPLPATARMPSRFQRHWLRYCATGALVLYGGLFIVRHSRLAGSDDLDRWILTAISAVRSALRTHVAEPLAAVRDELFRTFRDRPAIASPQDFSLSRESLLRMLADFAADHQKYGAVTTTATSGSSSSSSSSNDTLIQAQGGVSLASPDVHLAVASDTLGGSSSGGGGSSSGADTGGEADDPALAAGMAILMRSYEDELRHPLRNLVLGDLARALLIQVQRVKVDGEAAMLRLDQILRANELSLSLMAAMPALGISMAVALGATRLVIPRAPDRKRAAVPSRLAMASLEVALSQLAAVEEEQQQHEAASAGGAGSGAAAAGESAAVTVATAAVSAATVAAVEELRGLVVYRLCRVYSEVTALYATADRTSRYSEWRQLYDDLLRLAAPSAPRERLATHQRMMRTYTVFQR